MGTDTAILKRVVLNEAAALIAALGMACSVIRHNTPSTSTDIIAMTVHVLKKDMKNGAIRFKAKSQHE